MLKSYVECFVVSQFYKDVLEVGELAKLGNLMLCLQDCKPTC